MNTPMLNHRFWTFRVNSRSLAIRKFRVVLENTDHRVKISPYLRKGSVSAGAGGAWPNHESLSLFLASKLLISSWFQTFGDIDRLLIWALMGIVNTPLPEYTTPPVVETVFGITFNGVQIPTTSWGIYWRSLQPDFPKVDEAPPLETRIEIYPGEPVEFSGVFPPVPVRQMFTTLDASNVIQAQGNKFVFNWRKVSEDSEYPRFETVYAGFESQLEKFTAFLEKNGRSIVPVQYEVTYLNHVKLSSGKPASAEFETVIPSFSIRYPGKQILQEPDSVLHRVSFPLDEKSGRLYITVRNGMVGSNPVIVFELTVRGIPRNAMTRSEWFNMAREWIVRGFTDFTSEEYQTSVWGRTI